MFGLAAWSPAVSVAALLASAAVLLVAGTRFTHVVDRLADRLGIGEAIAGAILLGATTSLPGLIVTVFSAARGQGELAVSNALGGIAAQTMFLALADLIYRRANLEHAAASLPNLLQTMVLVALIAWVLLGAAAPSWQILGVHPVSVALPLAYVYGIVLTRRSRDRPMWHPRSTEETWPDVPDEAATRAPLLRLGTAFGALGAAVAVAGFVVAHAGLSLVAQTEISGTLIGAFVTSVVTSLPELVTVLAAVRMGALTLAVGDIIGGNSFDVLFVAAGDVAYRSGSIYAAINGDTLYVLSLTLLLTALLAAGLVYRERKGIGFEGIAILAVYFAGFGSLALA